MAFLSHRDIKESSLNTSTAGTHTSNSKQQKQELMGPFLSCILWWCHSQTALSLQLCMESPHAQICTYSGMVTTTWLLSLMSLTLWHAQPRLCYRPLLLKEEEDHLKQALQTCRYPVWVLNRSNIKHNKSNGPNQGSNNIRNKQASNNKPRIVVPCIKVLSGSCKHIYSKHGIQMFQGRQNCQESS